MLFPTFSLFGSMSLVNILGAAVFVMLRGGGGLFPPKSGLCENTEFACIIAPQAKFVLLIVPPYYLNPIIFSFFLYRRLFFILYNAPLSNHSTLKNTKLLDTISSTSSTYLKCFLRVRQAPIKRTIKPIFELLTTSSSTVHNLTRNGGINNANNIKMI